MCYSGNLKGRSIDVSLGTAYMKSLLATHGVRAKDAFMRWRRELGWAIIAEEQLAPRFATLGCIGASS